MRKNVWEGWSERFQVRMTIDCLIATFCLRGGHSLLHRDRDFDPFERYLRLSVIHPAVFKSSSFI